jgi:hypothetical protein
MKEQNSGAWIEWNGGEKAPVSPRTVVEVSRRNGKTETYRADMLRWPHRRGSFRGADIVAYREYKPVSSQS